MKLVVKEFQIWKCKGRAVQRASHIQKTKPSTDLGVALLSRMKLASSVPLIVKSSDSAPAAGSPEKSDITAEVFSACGGGSARLQLAARLIPAMPAP
jgi:hypothetical protein